MIMNRHSVYARLLLPRIRLSASREPKCSLFLCSHSGPTVLYYPVPLYCSQRTALVLLGALKTVLEHGAHRRANHLLDAVVADAE